MKKTHKITEKAERLFRFGACKAVCAVVLTAMLAMLGSMPAKAQQYLGTISGTVTDASGAKVANAEVTVTNTDTKFVTKGKSNASGAYTVPFLPPGTYTVTMAASSFQGQSQSGVVLTVGASKEVDFVAQLGAATETVNVVANNALLDTATADIATTLTTQEVIDTPNVGRNPYVLATLAPGVINGGSGGYFQGRASTVTNPFSGVAVQLITNGISGHNRLTLNGIPNDPAERLSGPSYTGFVPSPEAVQEVKVSSSVFDAQVGHGDGTDTNVVIRNGTNSLHGAAYYAFQNTYLNANLYQNNANGQARGNDQLNQAGFVVHGPVVIPKLYNGHDKTFFLVAFERYQSHATQNYTTRLPTPAELAGDFSGLCNTFDSNGFCTSGIQLYQPNSPVDPATGNRTQFFANNNISSQLNKTGLALAGYLPQSNIPGASPTAVNYTSKQNGYQSVYPSFVVRIDQTIGEKDKLNAIYFQAGLAQVFPNQGFTKGAPPSGNGYNVYRRTKGGALDEQHIFSPSLVLDSRFGLEFHPFGLQYPGQSGVSLSGLGISGTFPTNSFPGTSLSDSYPSLAAGASGQISTDTTGQLDEILTKSIGRHTVKAGFEYSVKRYDVHNPQDGFGAFSFDRRFTQKNSINAGVGSDPNSGDSFADQLLGYPSSGSYGINASYALQQTYLAGYAQDSWRATDKLTVSYGVRYDFEDPITERFNKQISGFCFTCTSPLQATVNALTLKGGLQYASSSNRYAYPRYWKAIQPRVGINYQLTPTTVFRAGFGTIYLNTLYNPIGTGYTQSTSYNAYIGGQSAPVGTISNPFPNGVVLPTGNGAGLSTGIGQSISFIDPNHVPPRSAQYTANVQQQLPGKISLQVNYVGSKSTRLEVSHNLNVLPAQYYGGGVAELAYLNTSVPNPMAGQVPLSSTLNAATIKRHYLLDPYPQYGSVTENYSSIGSVNYNALQIQVSHPMSHHISVQGNFTWDKVMAHNGFVGDGTGAQSDDSYHQATGKLYSVQDGSPTMFGNIFGTIELPKFEKLPFYEREVVGGWKFNSVVRMTNGALIGAPGNIDIIGDYHQPGANLFRQFNTCYNSVSVNTTTTTATYTPVQTKFVNGTSSVIACDSQSPTPAFQQRYQYSIQNNSPSLNLRIIGYHPLVDMSLFKQFAIREGMSFEIRGEYFNIFNTTEFGGPGGLGSSDAGNAAGAITPQYPNGQLYQNNDARIGQLTARFNF
jgi:hypothetical protein